MLIAAANPPAVGADKPWPSDATASAVLAAAVLALATALITLVIIPRFRPMSSGWIILSALVGYQSSHWRTWLRVTQDATAATPGT
jgi:hypothetical protein